MVSVSSDGSSESSGPPSSSSSPPSAPPPSVSAPEPPLPPSPPPACSPPDPGSPQSSSPVIRHRPTSYSLRTSAGRLKATSATTRVATIRTRAPYSTFPAPFSARRARFTAYLVSRRSTARAFNGVSGGARKPRAAGLLPGRLQEPTSADRPLGSPPFLDRRRADALVGRPVPCPL